MLDASSVMRVACFVMVLREVIVLRDACFVMLVARCVLRDVCCVWRDA